MTAADESAHAARAGAGAVVPSETAEELYEHAPCGYLSTLPDGRIIKVNETLLSWTGHRRDELIGRRFADVLSPGGRIYHETHYAPLLSMQGSASEIALDIVRADGGRLPVLVNSVVATTRDGDRVIRTSIFDATDRRAYERELMLAREQAERAEAHARILAETLQASLIPPSTPSIAGLDVAAVYRPAGSGAEVGGDFYDVFETRDGEWGIVLGDVCGKGAAAAAVTAMGRYTVRAAAMSAGRPSEVLTALNTELLRHPAQRFCTVVYLRVRPQAGKAEVTIASGGHPLPFLLTTDDVVAVGAPGTLLGVVDEPDLHDVTLVVEPGQAVFCYTDGFIEGRQGDDIFGEQRLRELLAEHRSLPAQELTHSVAAEIVGFQGGRPRDDMAAVLLGVPHPR